MNLDRPHLWNAEDPYLYLFVLFHWAAGEGRNDRR
ncbi:hypothetical protein [Bifidobacterium commune]